MAARAVAGDARVVREMADAIACRGPDDDGYFVASHVQFGFKRLSIIDLAGGHQPISTADGRFTIIFNGEIYNYREVRQTLKQDCAVSFATNSDTEVVLQSYVQWGPEALTRLNGMFAFAVWDREKKVLFLARDRFGKKPLFYFRSPNGFLFASEVKALLRHPDVSASVDPQRLAAFVAYRYVPGDEVLFAGIECVPPASWMKIWTDGEVEGPRRYWDYGFNSTSRPNEAAAKQQLLELLRDAVRLRMISDVPFGAFLSGGIDSSLIVALMSQVHPQPVKTFSVGFDTGFSELEHARAVARKFHCEHHEIVVTSDDLLRHMTRALWARETPISEPSDLPILLLSELARRHVAVVLSGEGSDEIFAGYPKYVFEHLHEKTRLPLPWRMAAAAAAHLPYRMRRFQLAAECAAQPDKLERYACWFGGFSAAERRELLAPTLQQHDVHIFSRGALPAHHTRSNVEQMLYLDTQHWLPANLLLRGDRMTMANSLELRCPFLDYRIAELAAQWDVSLKVRRLTGKWILKKVAEDLLPREIVHRRKWGFKVPVDEWFRGPLRNVLQQTLLSDRARGRGYFAMDKVATLIDAHINGRRNYEKQLWILFQLELWHLMFIDGELKPDDDLRSRA